MRHVIGTTVLGMALAACGGGTSTATLKLMDAPTDDLKKLEITVASMQVHVVPSDDSKSDADPNDTSIDEDSSWVSLAVNKKIDLLAHVGEGAADTLGELELPEGKITQIRLVLDTAAGANNLATKKDDTTCELDVSKVAKKGIKINHVFKAFQSKKNAKHEVIVDFNVEESIKDDKASGCWQLEPKLKLHKVKTDGAEESI